MTPASQPTVLVADDNHDAADSLVIALRHYGCEAMAVYDALQCLATASEMLPDAVVLDLHMPGMDGFTAARHLRLLTPPPHQIALTGDKSVEAARHCRALGFDAHWVKPIDPDRLAALIQALTEGEAPGASSQPRPTAASSCRE